MEHFSLIERQLVVDRQRRVADEIARVRARRAQRNTRRRPPEPPTAA